MVKIIINFRDIDTDNKKVNNNKSIAQIINFSKGYFNCESIEIKEE